ncbi:MAG: phospho-sugar mutase [Lachnospiraceae bacterium]|nr:phospho-sugar mutase [Lachnospiraceae bacterium]
MNAEEKYQEWLDRLPEGDPMRQELLSIRGNVKEINDRFYQEIVFGTAGLRGLCGAGTNRMNPLTVGRATQGIANYLKKSGEDLTRGVAVAYDCRHHSREYSELAAEILAGNGIRVWLFPSMRPTPELSFAVRELHTLSGINMTASHNPKEYNGYKVYQEDGAQISGEISDGILREIQALDLFDSFSRMPLEQGIREQIIRMIGEEMDRRYLDYAEGLKQRPDRELDRSVTVVYTPLNGAGSIPMETAARELGYENFVIVPEQKDPDPDFTTVGYPNPEDPKGFALAEKLGKKLHADLLIATDPDSDRMAVELPDGKGGFYPLNGNQTGAMLIAYMAESQKEAGTLPENAAMIKSIVTGDMGKTICESYGIRVFEALTGFKNICGVIPRLAKLGYRYFFAYEESIGCAPGEQVRDKDGIAAGLLMMEMAAYYRKKGMTLADALDGLYCRYGYFAERQVSLIRKGQTGAEEIARIMQRAREEKPDRFGDFQVAGVTDYIHGWEDIPAANVLKYRMENGDWFAMRPSGTEPKLKFYFYTRAESGQEAEQRVDRLRDAVLKVFN